MATGVFAVADPYTPTERRLLALLADGRPHSRAELHACLDDDLAAPRAIQFHVSRLRGKLRPAKQTVVCEIHRGAPHYRHVRLLEAEEA